MSTLILILQLIPALIQAVKAAEEFVPVPSTGKAKLDFILGTVSDVYEDSSKLVPQITAVVNRIVALANAVGLFKKA